MATEANRDGNAIEEYLRVGRDHYKRLVVFLGKMGRSDEPYVEDPGIRLSLLQELYHASDAAIALVDRQPQWSQPLDDFLRALVNVIDHANRGNGKQLRDHCFATLVLEQANPDSQFMQH